MRLNVGEAELNWRRRLVDVVGDVFCMRSIEQPISQSASQSIDHVSID